MYIWEQKFKNKRIPEIKLLKIESSPSKKEAAKHKQYEANVGM